MSSIKKNLVFAGLSQLIRYSAPLIVYPILARRLEIDVFASFSTILATGLIGAVFTEFGFGLMSVRELASRAKANKPLSVGTLIIGRLICLLLVCLVAIFVNSTFNLGRSTSEVFLVAIVAFAYGFSASWYFIAREKSKLLAKIDVACALVTLLSVFILIDQHSTVRTSLSLITTPLIFASLCGHLIAVRDFGFSIPSPKNLVGAFQRGSSFFILTGFTSLANRWPILALSIWSTPADVIYFAAGEKLTTAAINTTVPITRVLLPRVRRLSETNIDDSRAILKAATLYVFVFFTCASIATISLSSNIYTFLFGQEFEDGAYLFSLQMIMVPLCATSRVVAQTGFPTYNREQIAAKIISLSFALSIAATTIAAFHQSAEWVAISRAIIEFATLVLLLKFLFRSK